MNDPVPADVHDQVRQRRFGRRLLLRRWRAALTLSVLAIVTLMICDYATTSAAGDVVKASIDAIDPAPTALVLGTARLVGGRPNLYYEYRLDAAAELFRAGKVRAILVSGDNSRSDYNEPEAMRRDLVARGVPDTCITLDYAGFHTLDSVIRAKEVFGQQRLIIVSQRFHCERAVLIARAHGIDVQAYAAKDVPSAQHIKTRARETVSRLAAIVDVYVLDRGPKFLGPPVAVRFAGG